MHVFSNGITLKTVGNQTATATVTSSITGSASVTVNPAAADHLLFLQQPTDTAAGQTIRPARRGRQSRRLALSPDGDRAGDGRL